MDQFSEHRLSPEPDADGSGPPVLDGYSRGRKLGTGGSAEVWLVSSERTGRLFAAKVFDPVQRNDAHRGVAAGQARREMQLLDRLVHEHLVRLHDVVPTGGTSALIMDYAAGGSLAALVGTRGQLPVGEVVTILTPIAQCLAYLHGQGITHSDVAPGNVLFTELGKPLLSDLGLGRMTGENGATPAGTAGFEAPDGEPQWRKESLHPEDDVHGLAALGWYALTGRVPAAKDRRPPLSILVPDVPEELAAIIEAGLEPDAAARPSATEFEQAVYNSADALPVNLVQAVHESVLPHLLTRRAALDRKRKKLRLRLLRSKHPRQAGTRRRTRRYLRIPLAVAALLTAALVAGGLLTNTSTEPTSNPDLAEAGVSSSVPPSEPPSDRGQTSGVPDRVEDGLRSASPEEAVHALAWLRAYAFSSGRTGLLDQVNAPDSPAMAADSKIAGQLEQSGHVLAGFETRITHVERISAAGTGGKDPRRKKVGETAFIGVAAHSSGYTELDPKGDVVRREKPAGTQQLTLVLRNVGGDWLIEEILEPVNDG